MNLLTKLAYNPITKAIQAILPGGVTIKMDQSESGKFTPVAASVGNLDATPGIFSDSMLYLRVGKNVFCSGYVSIDATTVNVPTTFTLTLPIPPVANFTTSRELAGICTMASSGTGTASYVGHCLGQTGSKLALLGLQAVDPSAGRNFWYSFQYAVE